jgi:hypothetical protein
MNNWILNIEIPGRELQNEVIMELLNKFQRKITFKLSNTHFNERCDLEQEIKMKILEKVIPIINENNVPGFWDFINKGEDKRLIQR